MALTDNMRLYDIATRQAIYVEGVKVQESREFNADLFALREELRKLLMRVKYSTMDGLTKLELNRLVVNLRASQARVYSAYTLKLIQQLQDFMQTDVMVSRRIYGVGFLELDGDTKQLLITDDEAKELIVDQKKDPTLVPLFGVASITTDEGRLWSAIVNAPIPANGLYLLPFIKGFQVSAIAGVENIVRKAWANKMSISETIDLIVGNGEARQGTSNQLDRVSTQAAAVSATALAHVHAMTVAGVASALFNRYGWYSVMDGHTTDICIHRNLKTYTYGRGPIPPAHTRCRSHIAPIVGKGDIAAETFYAWLIRQPQAVQDDMLGEVTADAVLNGEVKAKDLTKVYGTTALTLKEYRRKIAAMLTR